MIAQYLAGSDGDGRTVVTIAAANNRDTTVIQRLSIRFEAEHPDIRLEWLVPEANILRQRVTTDIAVGGGQFDVITIGTYETPIWGRPGWLRWIWSWALTVPASSDVPEAAMRFVRWATSKERT